MIRKENGQICPVCARYKFQFDAMYEICPVCGWEDDGLQRDDPADDLGANTLCLNDYKKKWESGYRPKWTWRESEYDSYGTEDWYDGYLYDEDRERNR